MAALSITSSTPAVCRAESDFQSVQWGLRYSEPSLACIPLSPHIEHGP